MASDVKVLRFLIDVACGGVGGYVMAIVILAIHRWRWRRAAAKRAADIATQLQAECDRIVADARRDLDRIFGGAKGGGADKTN